MNSLGGLGIFDTFLFKDDKKGDVLARADRESELARRSQMRPQERLRLVRRKAARRHLPELPVSSGQQLT